MIVSDRDTITGDYGTVICPECKEQMVSLSEGVYCPKCEDYWEEVLCPTETESG